MGIKVIMLGFTVPNKLAKLLFEIDPMPAVQTHKFGWSFARALANAFEEVSLIASYPVQSFPVVRRLLFSTQKFCEGNMSGVVIGFINVPVLKHFTRLVKCLIIGFSQIKSKSFTWIFVHGVHTPYLVSALFMKLLGLRVAVILTDPPGVILNTDIYVVKVMKRMDSFLIRRLLKYVDAVIALSPVLVSSLVPNTPALIFPGILDSNISTHESLPKPPDKYTLGSPFTIIYAGGINSAYGIDKLIDTIVGFDFSVPIQLKLYGRGDLEKKVREVAVTHHRILYGGFIDGDDMLDELGTADLLINPRPTDQLISIQSFPSKLIEYLAIGPSVLTTRIASIPNYLEPFFYYIDDESIGGIREAIQQVIDEPNDKRYQQSLSGRECIRANLSEQAVALKISEFIKNLV